MAQEFQTSFIPKKTFDVGTATKGPSSLSGILSFVAIILFILSLVGAGGVFLYGRFLESSIVSKKDSLEKAKNAFEPELIRELSRLDSKFTITQQLLNSHLAPSGLFDLLEQVTLETIRFTNFSYAMEDKGIRITMQGEAASFASVALQSDEFTKNRSIREPVFSGLALDSKGNVTFNVTALIDPTVISYKDRVGNAGSAFFEVSPKGQVAGASTTTVNEQASNL